MSIRGFFRALFRPSQPDPTAGRLPEDDLADEIREAMGPVASGGTGGHITGSAIYKKIEEDAGLDDPDR